MVNLVDNLVARGVLDPSGVAQRTEVVPLLDASHGEMPRSILQMIERNVDQLASDEQLVLEAASVAGAEFSTAAVAAALEQPLSEVESCCKRLSRHERGRIRVGLLRRHGPDAAALGRDQTWNDADGSSVPAKIPDGGFSPVRLRVPCSPHR